MKMKARFSLHFIVGLFLWIISMGVTIMLTLEFIFPFFHLHEKNQWYDSLVLLSFLVNIALCSLLFAWYFGSPLWFIMTWVQQLSQGEYSPPVTRGKVYTRKHKLRQRYRLYEEVIVNVHALADHLKKTENERIKIEEAKKEWIAGISHDLKTPLTYITGYTTLLLNPEYSWTEEEKTSFIKEISQKGYHIESLIHDLNLSFQMNNIHSPIPLNKSENDIVEFTKNLIADIGSNPKSFNYTLSFQSSEGAINLSFDKGLMHRAIQNLIMNAIIHNPEGTNIHVEIKRTEEQFAEVIISDDGIGMDSETIDNLFSKYYRGTTTNTSDFGTGLGMAIVKSLIIAHGGHIHVQSELSKGTTISVTLPKGYAMV